MNDSTGSVDLEQGMLISRPVVDGADRRIWMAGGVMTPAHAPQPGVFNLYAPDFFLDDPLPWSSPDDSAGPCPVSELTASELLGRFKALGPSCSPPDVLDWTPPSRQSFEDCFHDLQTLFGAGRLVKAVPVFFEHAAFSPSAAAVAHWIAALLGCSRALMPYGRWSARGGILGASPELLFEVSNGVLTTVALAGTLGAPESTDPAVSAAATQSFLADAKERKEHSLVIDGIKASLAPFGAVDVGATGVLKLPTLWHLRTPITVSLQGNPSFETLVRCLHPTPALGGAPRSASLQWLRQQDAQAPPPGRLSFGAPFGAQLPDGSAFCLVAVRNLMWNADTLRIGAGCGVIRESRLEREWEELRRKRASVRRLLGL